MCEQLFQKIDQIEQAVSEDENKLYKNIESTTIRVIEVLQQTPTKQITIKLHNPKSITEQTKQAITLRLLNDNLPTQSQIITKTLFIY